MNLQDIFKIIFAGIISFLAIFSTEAKPENDKDFTIVIDAGHGGKDIGATDNGVKEKDINLKVAKNLESIIKKKMKNSRVVLTRDGDTYLTLQQRADKANKAQGDIFISIHTNSVDKRNKNRRNIAGSSVYTLGLHKDENNLEVARRENSVIELEQNFEEKYSGFDPQRDESYIIFEMAQKKNLAQSIRFAENVEKELVASGRQDRGVHQAGFWVLWATSMPSVLIELDFICNPESAKYISSDKGAKELAEAIYRALQKYESNWRKTVKGKAGNDLSNSYIEDSESNLEDSYQVVNLNEIATAKNRVHKRQTSPVDQKNSNNPPKRRRRSMTSRQISLDTSYEKDNISIPLIASNSSSGNQEEFQETQIIIAQGNTDKVNEKENKKKTKKPKQEKKKVKETKKRRDEAHNAKINKLITVYKIQVLASADLLNQSNSRFCGLSPITTYKENNLYKYYYGESTDKSEIESLLSDVRKKIPDAFIVSSQKSIGNK